ncbi:complement C1r-A subcomponent-like [Aplochiton taeniatus]
MNWTFNIIWLLFVAVCESRRLPRSQHPTIGKVDCGEPEVPLNGGVTFISGTESQYGSVIQYHCDAPYYSLTDGQNVCGQPTVEIPAIQRILGGAEAPAYAIPWQALLSVGGGRGGGIVIGDRWVMTAAHTLVSNGRMIEKDSLRVFIGDNDVDKLSTRPHATVVSLHVHPGYKNPNNLDYDNDIALIKLEHATTFNNAVMPICLPEKEVTYNTGQIGLVSGFGIQEGDIIANRLRYVRIPVVDNRICQESVSSTNNPTDLPKLTNNMFCAGIPESGKDSCSGDGGGVFSLRNGSRFWAAGIVSWGVDCGQTGKYGIYTRVANYVDWIKKTIMIDCGEPEPLLNGGVTFISGTESQYGSVIQYHCDAPYYSLPEGQNVCGQPTVQIPVVQRIFGGDEAPANTIPWQVILIVDGRRGGGVLIGDSWIMTVAHILVINGELPPKEVVQVFIGSNDVKVIGNSSQARVVSLHVHPEYNNTDDKHYDNDIALIKLQHPIAFHASVMPICLPVNLKDYPYKRDLTDNMFCAGQPEGGKDACTGDSGGVYAHWEGSRFWAVGLVSWGIGCGEPGQYGVFLRVVNYLDWINKTIREN